MSYLWREYSLKSSFPWRKALPLGCLPELQQRAKPIDLPSAYFASTWRPLHTETGAEPGVPLRKLLKDEAKQRRSAGGTQASKKTAKKLDLALLKKWELTVGIEIHAQLNTEHKLFSKAATSMNAPANEHVAHFDLAFPGSQPIFQKETLIPAVKAAEALGCTIKRTSRFDRKHYFYQDQPAGYQITQYYEPFAQDGHIVLYDYDGIAKEDGKQITIGIKQVQLEQDTAKTILQPPSTSLLDFNRVSHPLIEIITLPQIHHPSTAAACVRKIQALLAWYDTLASGMEMGGLRADVNVSVRLQDGTGSHEAGKEYYGVTGLGQRTEIKNLSSFKAVEAAVIAERDRQIELLESGGVVEGETRGWTLGSTETERLRGKEGEIDYRYMPDPDLAPVIIGKDLLGVNVRRSPDQEITDLTRKASGHNLTLKDARTLVALDDGSRLDWYKEVVKELRIHLEVVSYPHPVKSDILNKIGKTTCNWVLHELGGLLANSGKSWDQNPVTHVNAASLLCSLLRKEITGRTAKHIISLLFQGDQRTVLDIIEGERLRLIPLNDNEYQQLAQNVLAEHPDIVEQIVKKQQVQKIQFFVGQMMREGEEGRVEPEKCEIFLNSALAEM
ncbi:MAG: hypothetical protein M1812_001356 [Candelaria pacifica]|nr:MAG: hypothetical protein M1812_001356 [Candelaria pacifica]